MEHTRQEPKSGKRALRVLVMDSDVVTRQYVQRALSEMGYAVSPVASSAEAIGFFRIALEQHRPYHAVMLTADSEDDAAGEETLEQLRTMDPNVQVIVTGADPKHPLMSEYGRYGFRSRLVKPYSESELAAVLAEDF